MLGIRWNRSAHAKSRLATVDLAAGRVPTRSGHTFCDVAERNTKCLLLNYEAKWQLTLMLYPTSASKEGADPLRPHPCDSDRRSAVAVA
jgi:hypothetical protein